MNGFRNLYVPKAKEGLLALRAAALSTPASLNGKMCLSQHTNTQFHSEVDFSNLLFATFSSCAHNILHSYSP